MEFQRERVYTALNADELKAGDKVFVADQLSVLKQRVQEGKENSAIVLQRINGEDWGRRFGFKMADYALAYLVERKENCTNCGKHEDCGYVQNQSRFANLNRCEDYSPKTEQKAEDYRWVNYRPFKDTDELIKVFCEKTPKIYDKDDEKLFMPYIWVRNKENKRVWLITEFDNRLLDYLFTNCEFLDGSPCGVEE